MRRVGKSTILEIIKNEVLKSVPIFQKIHINFESLKYREIRDSDSFANYITESTKSLDGKIYFFFDEIQEVEGWESVINGIRVDFDCDI